jgi:hypothetical protein
MASSTAESSSPRKIEMILRRRLVCAEPVVVAGGGDGDAQQVLIIVHRLDDRAEKSRNCAFSWAFRPGSKQVLPVSVEMRPVVVLAAAVDAGKGLFVEQADQAVALRRPSSSAPL